MNTSRRRKLQVAFAAIVVLTTGLSAALALKVPDTPGRFDSKVIPDPSVVVSPMILGAQETAITKSVRDAWGAFKLANGEAWEVYLDTRSGAPTLVQGQGIPFIPGGGNTLASAAPVTLDSIVAALRGFAAKNAGLLVANDKELVLNEAASGQITPDLWQVQFNHAVSGVPVAGDSYVFYIGHGNLISFGAPRWSAVTTDPVPTVPANEAFGSLANYMGLTTADKVAILDAGTLTFLPMTAVGAAVDSFDGVIGTGYRTSLAWRISLQVDDAAATWVGLVDAHTGAVLALNDDTRYAQTKGGIFPLTDDGTPPDGVEVANYPMPWANITIGANNSATTSMGYFACTPGGSTATTTLQGTYIKVSDNCGAISKSVTCDADLDLGTSSGTDCTTPGSGGAGNTHAARSSFYHLNRIKEHARWWLPSNTWLQGQLTDNVNINLTCNAFWSPSAGTVNFYRSGGGCRNTGEIAAVFLHEWGHGLDQNDGGGSDNPGEAYADISSFLLTHKSCIGRGFTSSNCSGYGNACLNCTGVRDQDWNQHSTHTAQTADNWSQMSSCGSGTGPCSKEVHCESYVSGEAVWDLAVRDLTAAGIDQQTAWQLVDRMWFVSRNGSGGNAYSCGSPASNRSCATTTWMQKLRAVDDDDGNLANGTPHAAAIFAAFNRHNIQCGASTDASNLSTTTCPTLAATTVTASGSTNTITLNWTAVPNAASYNVLRNDQSCDWGHTIIANVAGTSYADSNLPNGFPLYYSIQAVGSNSACVGTLATCITAQATATPPSADLSITKTDSPDPVATGANITYMVTVTNGGPDAATTVQLSDAIPTNTTFQSITPAAGWTCSTPSVGGTGTISCTVSSLASSGQATFTIVVKVNWCTGNGTVISNSASVSSATTDPNTANNTATATTSVTDSGACNDGNACTQTDTCQGSTCVGSNPVICTALDQCHDVGTCTPSTGVCTNPNKANGTACNDGNLCTQTDTCQSGTCTGSNPITCTALDQCHDVGTCTPATGVCTNPNKPNGTSCNDGDLCTKTDTCQNGTCTGGGAVVCTAQDQCHDVGTCNPASGLCSKPTKPDGAACNDGSLCTQTDTCQSGACVGGNPVVCTAQDQCHDVGICSPSTGACSNPNKPNGTTCNDGNLCTQTDTCQSGTCTGSNPVVCGAQDQCHDAGTCNPSTGVCSNPAKPDGSACNDGNLCTQTDTCQGGTCTGSNPVVCSASDQCHDAGICNPATGACSNPAKPNGAACNDGDLCTQTDTCQSGACVGDNPVVCSASDQCHAAGTCDRLTGQCSNPAKPSGTACNDGDLCTQTDSCQNGACVGANPIVCTASDQCHDAGTCNPGTGACSNPDKPNGTACNDGNPCTQTDACQNGACVGANPVVCTASNQCHDAGTCNPLTGQCSNPAKPNGTVCNDGDLCTQADACQNGACVGANPVVCTALDQCHVAGTCDPLTGQCDHPAKPNGTVCNDGDLCTRADACNNGICVGADPILCTASDQCHDAGTCNPLTGQCSNPAKPNGAACNDGDPCTAGETCANGLCGGGRPVPPPPEVGANLMVTLTTQTSAQITWSLPLGAAWSDLLRGLASALPVGPGGGDEACIGPGTAGSTAADNDVPPAGDSFWYLVRGANLCGKGSYGFQVDGAGPPVERVTATCP